MVDTSLGVLLDRELPNERGLEIRGTLTWREFFRDVAFFTEAYLPSAEREEENVARQNRTKIHDAACELYK